MNKITIAITACLAILLSGCQTVSQSATPALYELRSNILKDVRTHCVSSADKRKKANHTLISGAIQIGTSSDSQWVKADIQDSINRIKGKVFYDASAKRTYCGASNWAPAFAPRSWRDVNEYDALRLLGRSNPSSFTPTTSVNSTPVKRSFRSDGEAMVSVMECGADMLTDIKNLYYRDKVFGSAILLSLLSSQDAKVDLYKMGLPSDVLRTLHTAPTGNDKQTVIKLLIACSDIDPKSFKNLNLQRLIAKSYNERAKVIDKVRNEQLALKDIWLEIRQAEEMMIADLPNLMNDQTLMQEIMPALDMSQSSKFSRMAKDLEELTSAVLKQYNIKL